MTEPNKQITMPNMCDRHQQLLVHQARFKETDTWRALIIVTQIALMQAATCDSKTHDRIGDDITKISELGCLACYKPDAFGEIVEQAKTHDLEKIMALGERWLSEAAAT